MKNAVFWDVAPWREHIATVYSHLLTVVHRSGIASTLKMEAAQSSETSVNKIPTRRHIAEDGIFHSLICRPIIVFRRYTGFKIWQSKGLRGVSHEYQFLIFLLILVVRNLINDNIMFFSTETSCNGTKSRFN
jgi:hypothetical protein